jgi:hypothetical protein
MKANGAEEVWLTGLLEPHTIVPAQYFSRARTDTGEKRLMAAILQDAIDVYCKFMGAVALTRHNRRLLRDTIDWFYNGDEEHPFSFVNVCDALSLDAKTVRRALYRTVVGQSAADLAYGRAVGA